MAEASALWDLLSQTADADAVAALKVAVQSDPDRALNRINPLAFASGHGLNEEATIGALVHAARLGIFDMSWNVLCPGCGGVLEIGRRAEDPQPPPVFLLALRRRLRADARPAGRGHLHGEPANPAHRRA